MKIFNGIAEAADATRTFMIASGGTLPEHIKDKVLPYSGTGASPVDLVVHFAEAIYANRDDEGVSDEAREIAAGCAVLAETYGFHGMNEKSRGSGLACELAGKKKAAKPPEAKADYRPQPEVPADAEAAAVLPAA